MIGPPFAGRLEQLYALRERLALEIRAEEQRRAVSVAERHAIAERRRQLVEPTPAEIRAWATRQGIDVGARGRIPAGVRQQYLDANAGLLALVPSAAAS